MNKKLLTSLALCGFAGASLQAAVVLADDFESANYIDGTNVAGTTGIADTGSYDGNWQADAAGGFGKWDNGTLAITRPSGSFGAGYYSARVDAGGSALGGSVLYFSAEVTITTALADLNSGLRFGLDLDTNGFNAKFSEIGLTSAGEAAIYSHNLDGNYSEVVTATTTGSVSVTTGETYLLVGKIEDTGSGDVVSMWFDPTRGGSESTATISENVGTGGLFPGGSSIDWLHFGAGVNDAGETINFDNITIGTEWGDVTAVPEPSSYALLAGFLALGWIMVRRRKA